MEEGAQFATQHRFQSLEKHFHASFIPAGDVLDLLDERLFFRARAASPEVPAVIALCRALA